MSGIQKAQGYPIAYTKMSGTLRLTLFTLALFGLFAAYLYNSPYAHFPDDNMPPPASPQTTAIVVGSGLAGLSAASQLITRNVPVRLLERGIKPGGNSIKASSGINGAPTRVQAILDDAFFSDTINSAGKAMLSSAQNRESLISTLTDSSKDAVEWLVQEKGIDLSKVSIMGGHTFPRTHRGADQTPPGFAIITTLLKSLKESPLFRLQTSCTVTKVLQCGHRVTGVEYTGEDGSPQELLGPVIFASGGFGGDAEGLLAQYRPDLKGYPSTNDPRPGTQPLLTAIGAQLIDMEYVQVHPTGFVDPASPASPLKFLAAEVLRGDGGILLSNGKRFFNELEIREKVTNAITAESPVVESPKQWSVQLVLDEGVYEATKSHVDFYIFKRLMKKVTISDLPSDALGEISRYCQIVRGEEADSFGRTQFAHWSLKEPTPDSVVYVGFVTPVVHFTMGGVTINDQAEVLKKGDEWIEGLWAAGENASHIRQDSNVPTSSLQTPFAISFSPILKFALFSIISNPPNILWQTFLEDVFPSKVPVEPSEKQLKDKPVQTRTSKRNLLAKFILDQTIGAVVNTLMFLVYMAYVNDHSARSTPSWYTVQADVSNRFWPMVMDGYKFWPAVSLISFLWVPVDKRVVFGCSVGVLWGIYLSLSVAS
ncbi:uncharacterized protein N0V89_004070 [Didymosphaeria variabile]|uniref:FAD-dependent oxidoreductase 2 FAD-binding domain-containing protein n=1 Tax=Didymosphaeria variabile TaxID=1932322 RepID=A0A9W8XRG3_9PLEO|nr:uncharacterized protein N0V89_004070 [Didymosphaeria variabile]KAJ4356043.1 hypothetical protein N0V89_004070 [Didymosphaeria variabile]